MAAIYSILDGCTYGFGLPILPVLVEDISSETISTNQTLLVLSSAVLMFHLGKSVSAGCTACSIWENTIFSVIISGLVFVICSLVSNVAWILVTRFLLGLLSGYLGSFSQPSRVRLFSRLSWIGSVGISSCLSGALYVGNRKTTLVNRHESLFFHQHPAFISACAVAALAILSFVCYVLLENLGFDETDTYYHHGTSYSEVIQSTNDEEFGHLHEPEAKRTPFWSTHGDTHPFSGSSRNVHAFTSRLESYERDWDKVDLIVPSRYQRGCGEPGEALRRWRLTLEWRKEQRIDEILSEPQPNFGIIKQCYPHYIHGKSRQGQPVYYEQIGRIDIQTLKANGVSIHELLRHYIFITEYMWNIVEPDDDYGQTVTILDVEGVSMSDLIGDALDFLTESSKVISSHYVERCRKIYVVNASYMFSFLWKMVLPLIHENTREKVSILSASEMKVLQELIDPSELPEKYGGTSGPLGTSSDEIALLSHVKSLQRGEGVPLTIPVLHSIRPGMEYKSVAKPQQQSVTSTGNHMLSGGNTSTSGTDKHDNKSNRSSSENHCGKSDVDSMWSEGSEGQEIGESDDDIEAACHEDTSSTPTSWLRYGQRVIYSTVSAASSAFIPIRSSDSHQVHLGDSNSFVYNSETQKWELLDSGDFNSGQVTSGTSTSPSASPSMVASVPDGTCLINKALSKHAFTAIEEHKNLLGGSDAFSGRRGHDNAYEDEEEEEVIRAIQAAHGYVSESDTEDGPVGPSSHRGGMGISYCNEKNSLHAAPHNTSIINRYLIDSSKDCTNVSAHRGSKHSRKMFRMNIKQKKLATLQAISLWSLLHFTWRASLMCSMEALPVYVLLSKRHNGLGKSPYVMGLIGLITAVAIGVTQYVVYRRHPLPYSGFFWSSLLSVLIMEISSLSIVIGLAITLSPSSASMQHTIINDLESAAFVLFLGVAFGVLLFSFNITNIFTAAVMASHKSHFYSSLARSNAYIADAIGSFLGIILVLVWDDAGVPSTLALLTPFVITIVSHLAIAIVNSLYPRAAGHGVELGNIVW